MSYATAKTPIFLMTALALSLSLTACNKTKKTDTTTVASSTATTSTTTTTVIETSSATNATLASAPASTTDGTLVASGVAVTSAPAMTASATAMTALQMANVGDPKTSVKNVMEGLRTGRVTYAMGFIQSGDKNLKKVLIDSLPMYKDIKSIKYSEPLYDDDKTRAIVKAIITTKSSKAPVEVPYGVQKTMTGWKVLAQTAPQTTNPAMSANPNMPNTVPMSKNGKTSVMPATPVKLRTDTVVTSKTKAGTPEDTLKQAINTMIKAPTSEAVKFYSNTQPMNVATTAKPEPVAPTKAATKKGKKDSKATQPQTLPPPTLEEKVAMQQALFIQTLQNVKIGKTQYNKNKTEAVVSAVFTPFAKTGSKPQNLEVKMKKEKDGWKIISE